MNETMDGAQALDALLETERDALLKGNLAALTALAPRKEALIDALKDAACTRPALERLDKKVKRNQLLLDGAMEGIRAVAGRLAAVRQVRGGLETYGSDGTRRNIEVNVDHAVERRA